MKKIFFAVLIILTGMSWMVFCADAAEQGKGIVVADVSIYEPKIVSQTGNVFKVFFTISNKQKTQPDIRYAIQLLQTQKDNPLIADEKVFAETLNLKEGETRTKEITYIAPNFLKGNYEMSLVSRTSSGLPLAIRSLGQVTLSGSGRFIDIKPESCSLAVEGETGDKKYTLGQAVDITPQESLIITCEAANLFEKEIIFNPKFSTYAWSSFNQSVETSKNNEKSQTIKPKESKKISFVLPKSPKPNAYQTRMDLESNGEAVASPIFLRYITQGPSAIIQNLRLDKDYYAKGEKAAVSFMWFPSMDEFSGTRGKGTPLGNVEAIISIKNTRSEICANSVANKLKTSELMYDFSLSIVRDCQNPQVLLTLKQDGKEMISRNYSFDSGIVPTNAKKNNYNMLIAGMAIIIILAMIGVLWRKNKIKNKTAMLFLIMMAGSFLCSVYSVKAETLWCNRPNVPLSWQRGFWYGGSFDKSSYSPNEQMTFNGTITESLGGQPDIQSLNATMSAGVNTNTRTVISGVLYVYGGSNNSISGSATFTAPSTSGSASYSAGVTIIGTNLGWSCGEGSAGFTITSYSCQGPVPANASKCSGSDTGLTNNTTSWHNVSSCTGGKCEYTSCTGCNAPEPACGQTTSGTDCGGNSCSKIGPPCPPFNPTHKVCNSFGQCVTVECGNPSDCPSTCSINADCPPEPCPSNCELSNPPGARECDPYDRRKIRWCAFTNGGCNQWQYHQCDLCQGMFSCGNEDDFCFNNACCHPSCDNKQCGSDGCGGSCGSCPPGQYCSNNQCVAVACTVSISASRPNPVPYGQATTITWSSTYAVGLCTATGGSTYWAGVWNSSGSWISGALTQAYTYIMTCYNSAGTPCSGDVPVGITNYSCIGPVPSNATLCLGDDTGLSADMTRSLVLSCTATKCEYTCNSGYVYKNGLCVHITYSWQTSDWSDCSPTCGEGTKTRSVWCAMNDTDLTSVEDKYCTGTKPSASDSCNDGACPTTNKWKEVTP